VAPINVIVNESAGSGDTANAISDAFAAAGVEATISVVARSRLAGQAARAAAQGGVVVAVGGDGTVSTVASAAVLSGATLGVVPAGTLNHFARDVGVPPAPADAVAAIVRGQVRTVDVGEVNGRLFVNNASIGIYPRLVRERESEQRRGHRKWIAFAIAVARTWLRYRQLTVRIVIGGREYVRRTPFVVVGNGEYHAEGLQTGARESLEGATLSVYVAPRYGRLEILAFPFRVLTGRLSRDVAFETFLAREVSIETARSRVSVALDGEIAVERSPLNFRIRPRALRVLAPPVNP
jgi:diacylglycerol kinase family enzyme